MLPASILALPAIAPEVPAQYVLPGDDALAVPLTIALLEAGVISDAMLRTPRNALLVEVFGAQEKHLAERALAHWWTKLIRARPCKFFRWELHVQQLEDTGHGHDKAHTAWFCFTRMGCGNNFPPRFALSKGIEHLERLLEGFGQTVLAVLQDATLLLPDAHTPWGALGWVEAVHWRYSDNDIELLENRRIECGYDTVAELVENEHVVTREVFYRELPKWVCAPKRVRSRAEIEAAASTVFALQVVAVCDALHALVSQSDFILTPADKGTYRCGRETIDGSMILLWKQHDVIGEMIDEYLNELGNCGEYCDFIDANPVPMTAAGVHEFMTKTEQAIQVAVLTEKLILLLGEEF
ncbi:MAG TPA: hypothetical protein DEP03_06580 [Massilia sp.]|nr:hypothetical protein [Massilia sp.]